MPKFRKKSTRSPEYFGDPVFSVGNFEPGMAVYLSIDPEGKLVCLRHGEDELSFPYRSLQSFVVDNEARIRDGESPIAAKVLEDFPRLSNDSITRMEQNSRWMSTRWFGELRYTDEEGNAAGVVLMERKRSGYNLDVIKSMQASDMEKFVGGIVSADGEKDSRE